MIQQNDTFQKITPEQAGISSDNVRRFILRLEEMGASTHQLIMMKDGKIFAEEYWAPFHKDFLHRMYSQTKSYVGIAIGLALDDGFIRSLDDKIIEYFPEKLPAEGVNEHLSNLTIRQMLTMNTAGTSRLTWFVAGNPDRTNLYFCEEKNFHPSDCYYAYDSAASQVLCALVEKLSGKKLIEYLRERVFKHLGTFEKAYILETPNGDSWGDSGLMCTLRDMASLGQFCMQNGNWKGKQLISEKYMSEATSCRVSNYDGFGSSYEGFGYGYQIWRMADNGFAFVGMGDQITMCFPDKGLICAWTSNNQGTDMYRKMMVQAVYDLIERPMKNHPLRENKAAQKRYRTATKNLKLFAVKGREDSPFRERLNKTVYVCDENPMGIKKFWFTFRSAKSGCFHYVNGQGKKTIPFGVNKNVFGKFPQLGYSNDRGAVRTTDGFMYDDAVSFAWTQENQFVIRVQIIDRYFGNLRMRFGFNGDDCAAVFSHAAEDFLQEYSGEMVAHKKATVDDESIKER